MRSKLKIKIRAAVNLELRQIDQKILKHTISTISFFLNILDSINERQEGVVRLPYYSTSLQLNIYDVV